MSEAFAEDEALRAGWRPLSPAACGGLAVLWALVLLLRWRSGEAWVPVLDSFNLALHEAGHPLVGMFSDRLMVYGGTMFQLAFPLLVWWHFRRRHDAMGAAAGVLWLGENLLNVGRYMSDARAQVLPLFGGGEHDWTEIFLRWGVLAKDVKIGGMTIWLGHLLMLGAVVWLWRRYRAQQTEPMESS